MKEGGQDRTSSSTERLDFFVHRPALSILKKKKTSSLEGKGIKNYFPAKKNSAHPKMVIDLISSG